MAELEEIQLKSDHITDQTLDSTRRMMQLCEESQDVGVKTLVMLNDQGEQLERIEENMDAINADMIEAEKHLTNMEKCCRIFSCCPCGAVSKTKDGTRPRKLSEEQDIVSSQPTKSNAYTTGNGPKYNGGYIQKITNDDREDEMDENMGQVSMMIGNLRNMATDMGSNLDTQNQKIERINVKAQGNEDRIMSANVRVSKLLRN